MNKEAIRQVQLKIIIKGIYQVLKLTNLSDVEHDIVIRNDSHLFIVKNYEH